MIGAKTLVDETLAALSCAYSGDLCMVPQRLKEIVEDAVRKAREAGYVDAVSDRLGAAQALVIRIVMDKETEACAQLASNHICSFSGCTCENVIAAAIRRRKSC